MVNKNKNIEKSNFGIKINNDIPNIGIENYLKELNHNYKLSEFYYTSFAKIKSFDNSLFTKKGITLDLSA